MHAKKALSVAAVAALALGISGCGDSHDSVMEDQIAAMKDFGETLKKVTDAASAKSNAPALKAIGEKMKAIEARGKKLGDPDAKEQERLAEKHKKGLTEAMTLVFSEMMRVGMLGPDVQKELGDLDAIPGSK